MQRSDVARCRIVAWCWRLSVVALATILALVVVGRRADPGRAAATAHLTKRYSLSRLAEWKVRARPAGADCSILLIDTGELMDQARIEALQYGVNFSEIYEGGAHEFARDNNFGAVVYRDGAGAVWVYDASGRHERYDPPAKVMMPFGASGELDLTPCW